MGTQHKVAVRPIEVDDLPAVSAFLHENLNQRVPVEGWARAVAVPWQVAQPNAGFMLVAGTAITGVHLAFYADRQIEGQLERFCNLGAWCVLPDYRIHGIRLLRALLAQEGYTFTDLSPSGNVVSINSRLGFSFLDTTTSLMPNLPWPSRPRRDTITSDPALLERTLQGTELQYYRDHAGASAAKHLLLMRGQRSCYVVFRKDRRKGMPLFASLLYVSDPELFLGMARPLARHLLVRERIFATLIEGAVVPRAPRFAVKLTSSRRKMFRSDHLQSSQIDFLYSELACLSW
ncbi:MAG TPA: hypothetical protein VHV75_12895 [Solirubrobacteraceae bacterium]|jgi:hypothetical protein|nr:hypothetical protein [Solirubrobacteraceae bacterium]